MQAGPLIRHCTAADIPAVRTLLLETWHATYDGWLGVERVDEISSTWHSEGQLAAQVGKSGGVFLVAEQDGALVGTTFAHIDADDVEIGRLYVHPAHQRRGIGTALFLSLRDGFAGAARFHLDVEPRNEGAIRFYRRHGFRVVDRIGDGSGGPGIAALRMEWRPRRPQNGKAVPR